MPPRCIFLFALALAGRQWESDEAQRRTPLTSSLPPLRSGRAPVVFALRHGLRVFFANDARFLSAAIAFYALLSVVPLLFLALLAAGFFVEESSARAAMTTGLARFADRDFATTIVHWIDLERGSIGHGVAGIVVFMYSATRLFAALERGLNAMWEIEPEPTDKKARIMRQLRTRGLSFVVALALGVLLVGTVAFNASVAWVAAHAVTPPPAPWALQWLGTLSGTALVFFMLFAVLPAKRAPMRDTALGACFSAALFVVGVRAVTWYVGRRAGFGVGESLMVLLWLRYAAQVFLGGAAFVGAYMKSGSATFTA